MKRILAIIGLVLILVAVCTFEEIFLKNFTTNFTTKAESISNKIKDEENINNDEIKNPLSDLQKDWHNAKITLCFFTNYEKIKTMDESFIKLKAAIENNDKDTAVENIALISNYQQFFNYMLGFNLNNLF